MLVNVDFLIANFNPRAARAGRPSNDGWRLRELRRHDASATIGDLRAQEVQTVLSGEPSAALAMLRTALERLGSEDGPRRHALCTNIAYQLTRAGQFGEAADLYGQLTAEAAVDSSWILEACWADAVLSHALITRVGVDADVARRCSAAIDRAAGERGVTHTRALFALIEGDPTRAAELAVASMQVNPPLTPEERSIVASTAVMAYARCGNLPAARAWLHDVVESTAFGAAAYSEMQRASANESGLSA